MTNKNPVRAQQQFNDKKNGISCSMNKNVLELKNCLENAVKERVGTYVSQKIKQYISANQKF